MFGGGPVCKAFVERFRPHRNRIFRWGHSPGVRVDDEAVSADNEGEASWK